jgi:N-methylhydantoinase B
MTSLARLEVFQHLFAAIAEEMGATLMRSAFSPNIKERRDFSCAVLDASGRMLAQAAHIPIHLGSIPMCVGAVIRDVALERGDAVILNDPYRGGTHLPDITLVSPVFLPGRARPDFFVANRAHHADVGGAHPGSMAPANDVHAKARASRRSSCPSAAACAPICSSSCSPTCACRPSARPICSRSRRPTASVSSAWANSPRSTAGVSSRSAARNCCVDRAPDARPASHAAARRRTFEDVLDPSPEGGAPVTLRVTLEAKPRELVIDFRASDAQVGDGLNATRAVAVSAAFYCLRTLLPAGTPTNDGLMQRVRVLTREGTVVDARYPAPVAAGNVETSQRLVDVLLGALAKLLPRRVPAASSGTMSNFSFGGVDARGAPFTYYETIAGGAGASRERAGASAVHTHMTNTRNTPIEAFERQFPVRVLRYAVRRGSGGDGARRGGDGIEKRLLFLAPCAASWIADRQTRGPWGLAGGERGAAGRAELVHAGSRTRLASRASFRVDASDEVALATPGGGGHGRDGAR